MSYSRRTALLEGVPYNPQRGGGSATQTLRGIGALDIVYGSGRGGGYRCKLVEWEGYQRVLLTTDEEGVHGVPPARFSLLHRSGDEVYADGTEAVPRW